MKLINTNWLSFHALFFLLFIGFLAEAQPNITAAEYFFDTDPGPGNGTAISITPGTTVNVNNLNVPTTSLSLGWHLLCARVKDANNVWGFYETRAVYVSSAAVGPPPPTPNIISMEYFFDTDPGLGNGTAISITNGTTVNVNNLSVPTTSLGIGWHTLHVRSKDANNVWGYYETRTIYVSSGTVGPPPTVPNTVAMEYFFDTDPGPGNGIAISITPGLTVNVNNLNVPTTSLSTGWHTINVRSKDANNAWGFYETRTIYVSSGAVGPPPPAPNTVAMEYFFDTDPGPGNGQPISITAGTTVNIANANLAPISPLSIGWHTLYVRSQDANSKWGFYETRTVFVSNATQTLPPPSPIVALEYFVDTDPGAGQSPLTLVLTPSILQDLQNQPLNVGNQSLGSHTLGLRVQNSDGQWSLTEERTFTVVSGCTSIVAPTTTDDTRCTPGTLNLTASGATGSQTYRWYADNTTLAIAYTGTPFTTPSLTVNTDYYVSIYDPTTFCESPRTKASAIVSGIPKPTLNLTGAITVCQGNTVNLLAPPGFSSYAWSNGLTTQQITVATSGSYSVVVGNGTCLSPSSDSFTLTVNANPSKPIINSTGGGSLCGTGSITLSAPSGFPIYSWSSGQSTQSIVVNSTGSFTVMATDANGCQSVASDVFTVTSSAPAKPTISITGNTTLCNNSTVDLSAPSGFTNYNWSNGATAQNITVNAAGNYTVTVANGTCSSVASDAVVVTSAILPTKPVVQITGSTSLCTGAFVILTVPSGFTNYNWSNGETSRQIVVSTAGNYSVQVGSASNCLSVSSDDVVVTTTGLACTSNGPTLPRAPSVTNGSNCGAGAVTLSASGATAGLEYRWYDVSIGGTSLSSSASYQTDSLSQTKDFYVAIYDPVISAEGIRTKATASIITLQKPVLTPSGTFSICAGGSTLITAPEGFAQYRWSNGGNVLNSSAQLLQVTTAGTYSVQTSDGTCFSPTSDPVVVSIDAALAKPTISGNTTVCGTGTVTLTASSGTQYLWSNNETTQSITVSEGTYSVTVSNATCTSPASDAAIVVVASIPSKPVISAVGKEFICGGSVVALSAPAGFTNYIWSNGETTQTIVVDKPGKFSVQTGMAPSCLSPSSDDKEVKAGTTNECGLVITPDNRAPVIQAATFAIEIQSVATYPLTGLITDENNNLDISTLRILDSPNSNGKASGGQASLESDNTIRFDYKGINFSGEESITLQVCDTEGVCSQQKMMIEVVGNVLVYNGITPDGDGYNDFMLIQFIDIIDGAKKNKVTILDRWGDVVFTMDDYNNSDRVFTGNTNGGGELPAGTYLYKVNLASGKTYTGFITLKR